ncbi:MAG: glycine zipper 2TM domain-containing protein, partial [Steroidobacteraceae bacterium]
MNKSMVTGLVIGAAVAVGGGAVAGLKMMNRQLAYATVTNVTPLTRTVRTPRQACHDEQVTHTRPAKDQHDVVGTVAGAVVGGLLGNQVGGGH